MQELQQYLALGRNVSAALYGAAKKALGYQDLPTEMAVEGKDRSGRLHTGNKTAAWI